MKVHAGLLGLLAIGLLIAGHSRNGLAQADLHSPTAGALYPAYPWNIQFVSRLDLPGTAVGITAHAEYAFIAAGEAGLCLVNIANPMAPLSLDCLATAGYASDVVVLDDYAYVADGPGGLLIVNITDLPLLVEAGALATAGETKTLAVANGYVYLVAGDEGLRIVDVANPSAPVEVAVVVADARDVAIVAERAYLAEEVEPEDEDYDHCFSGGVLRILDIADPQTPVFLGSTPEPICAYPYGPHFQRMAVGNNHAYLPYMGRVVGTVAVFDVTDATAPAQVANGGYPNGLVADVVLLADHLYIVRQGGVGALSIINVTNPLQPRWIAHYPTSVPAMAVTVMDDLVYVANDTAGLLVLRPLLNSHYLPFVNSQQFVHDDSDSVR